MSSITAEMTLFLSEAIRHSSPDLKKSLGTIQTSTPPTVHQGCQTEFLKGQSPATAPIKTPEPANQHLQDYLKNKGRCQWHSKSALGPYAKTFV